jgi:hypothetical protein
MVKTGIVDQCHAVAAEFETNEMRRLQRGAKLAINFANGFAQTNKLSHFLPPQLRLDIIQSPQLLRPVILIVPADTVSQSQDCRLSAHTYPPRELVAAVFKVTIPACAQSFCPMEGRILTTAPATPTQTR